jgi:Transposase domain (DUF772)
MSCLLTCSHAWPAQRARRIVATVMVLQRLQGLPDREAVGAFRFDARWTYACGGLAFDYPTSAIPCW